MMRRLAILFALLPLLSLFCQEHSAEEFIARIKNEINATRGNAENVRLANEKLWNDHNKKMEELQKEADKLDEEIQELSNDIASLQQETRDASQTAAELNNSKMQLGAMLNCNASIEELASNLGKAIAQQKSLMEGLLANPRQAMETEAADKEGKIIRGLAYHIGPVKILSIDGNYAQLFQTTEAELPKLAGNFEATLPKLDVTGKNPELLTQNNNLLRHLRQGGIMMIPILFLAALCAALVLYKLLELVAKPLSADIRQLNEMASSSKSTGEKLEEELFVQAQQLLEKRQHLLFWLKTSAAVAPLLGLLGTVTGMIHTFKLITIFGVGNAKLLADGISEALITTEAGLCIAIPALLCHAWLSRIIKRHASKLEKQISEVILKGSGQWTVDSGQ